MSTVEHYRQEAIRCRQLAANEPLSKHVKRWIALAQTYDVVADGLERGFRPKAQQKTKPQPHE
jgi:hypothetical protein